MTELRGDLLATYEDCRAVLRQVEAGRIWYADVLLARAERQRRARSKRALRGSPPG